MVETIIPITNELHSPVRFRMNAVEQIEAFFWLEQHAQEMIGIYHSHLHGPNTPSKTDLEEFAYPGVLMLIWSYETDLGWQVCAYLVDKNIYEKVRIIYN